MNRTEIYKIRTHRTPIVCAVGFLLGVLAPSVVLLWYTPPSQSAYLEMFTASYQVLGMLLAVVFGGWILGTEYRQGTLKRVLATEPRRHRVIARKALVGASGLTAVMASVALIGWSAARLVGSMNDVTVPWAGRTLLAAWVAAMVGAAVSFSLSAITRSDSFAMVGTMAMMVVLDPILSLVPKVGKFAMDSALDRITMSVANDSLGRTSELTTTSAVVTLGVWLTIALGSAVMLFANRDV